MNTADAQVYEGTCMHRQSTQEHPARRRALSRGRPDNGFTLVEMTVVIVIMAIMFAIVIPQYTGGKRVSRMRQATAATRAYGDAINAFILDHGNVTPRMGNADEWPKPLRDGPISVIGQGAAGKTTKPYLHGGPPENMTSGGPKQARIVSDPASPNPPSATWKTGGRPTIVYRRTEARYTLTVYDEKGKLNCAVGNVLLTSKKPGKTPPSCR